MLCKDPYVAGKQVYGCGRCLPCRLQRRRQWASRIILESMVHARSSFVTLTYADEHIPKSLVNGLAELRPKDTQDWLKRLRKRLQPGKVRYFLVGEYGDVSWRPHYHVALFGFPYCERGRTNYVGEAFDCCRFCRLVYETWGKGRITNDVLCAQSAAYVAGYVTKKLTGVDDERLEGRHPEFARMSSVPGLGKPALYDIASKQLEFDDPERDIPAALKRGKQYMPLGRYLRRELRVLCGRDKNAPAVTYDEMEEKMRPVFEAARARAAAAPLSARLDVEKAWVKELLSEVNGGAHNEMEWKMANLGRKRL